MSFCEIGDRATKELALGGARANFLGGKDAVGLC